MNDMVEQEESDQSARLPGVKRWTMAMKSSCNTHVVGESLRNMRSSSGRRNKNNLSCCCRDEFDLRAPKSSARWCRANTSLGVTSI